MDHSLIIRQLLFNETSSPVRRSWPNWSAWQALQIVLAGVILGMVYPLFGDGFRSIIPYINGFLIGLMGGIFIAVVELYLSQFLRKRFSFGVMVCVKIFLYTALMTASVLSVILVSRSIRFDMSISEVFASEAFRHFIFYEDFPIIVAYALVLITVIIFTMEVSRKMGPGILFNFITGRYFKPRKEKRVFMFLDINSSVAYAEHSGDLAYHNFLNDFVRDITPGILASDGKIHQYVGDEVVVSWLMGRKSTVDHCLLAFLYSYQLIRGRRNYYEQLYGFLPSFKAAFHCGEVISGEIGEVKSEIVFHGDVVNTTARMERLCTDLGESLLVSQGFFQNLSSATREVFRLSGSVRLRGKEKEMQVFGLIPGTIVSTGTATTVSA